MSDKIASLMAEMMEGDGARSLAPRSHKRGNRPVQSEADARTAKALTASAVDPFNIPSAITGLFSPETRDQWREAAASDGLGPQIVGGSVVGIPGLNAAAAAGKLAYKAIKGANASRAGSVGAGIGAAGATSAASDVIDDDVGKKTVGKALLGSTALGQGALNIPQFGIGAHLRTGGASTDFVTKQISRLIGGDGAQAAPFNKDQPIDPTDPEMLRGAQEHWIKSGALKMKKADGVLSEGGPTSALVQSHNNSFKPKPVDPIVEAETKARIEAEAEERRARLAREKKEGDAALKSKQTATMNRVYDEVRGSGGVEGQIRSALEHPLMQLILAGGGYYAGSKARAKLGKAIGDSAAGEMRAVTGTGQSIPAGSLGGIPGTGKVSNPTNVSEAAGAMAPAQAARGLFGQADNAAGVPVQPTESIPKMLARGSWVDVPAIGGMYGLYKYTGSLEDEAAKTQQAKLEQWQTNPESKVFANEYENARSNKELLGTGRKFELGAMLGLGKGAVANAYTGRLGQMAPAEQLAFGQSMRKIAEAEANGMAFNAAQAAGRGAGHAPPAVGPGGAPVGPPPNIPPAPAPAAGGMPMPAGQQLPPLPPAMQPAPAAQAAPTTYKGIQGLDRNSYRRLLTILKNEGWTPP